MKMFCWHSNKEEDVSSSPPDVCLFKDLKLLSVVDVVLKHKCEKINKK